MDEFGGVGARSSRSDERAFFHKRIIGAVGGAIGGMIRGGPIGAIGGAIGGLFPGGPRTGAPFPSVSRQAGCPPGFQITTRGCQPGPLLNVILPPQAQGPRAGVMPQIPPTPMAPMPLVVGSPEQFGDATVGRFGAALTPAVRDTETRVCPRGAVLAVDGLCYNRSSLRNTDRMWPRGRRPLLTGGQMRAISIASSAAKALQRKQKQLQALGMLKAPSRRAAPKALPPAHHHHDH